MHLEKLWPVGKNGKIALLLSIIFVFSSTINTGFYPVFRVYIYIISAYLLFNVV